MNPDGGALSSSGSPITFGKRTTSSSAAEVTDAPPEKTIVATKTAASARASQILRGMRPPLSVGFHTRSAGNVRATRGGCKNESASVLSDRRRKTRGLLTGERKCVVERDRRAFDQNRSRAVRRAPGDDVEEIASSAERERARFVADGDLAQLFSAGTGDRGRVLGVVRVEVLLCG